jgi:hypothetical protein
MATITIPNGNTFEIDSLKAATFFEAGSSISGRGGVRPLTELLLSFKDNTHVQIIKGAEAEDVYEQLKAAEFPALFQKWRERL